MHIVAVDTRLSGPQDVLFEAQRNAFIHTVFEQLQFQLGSAEAGLPGFIDSMIVASRDGQPEVVPKRLLNPNSVSALLGQPVLPIAGDEPANCGWTFIQGTHKVCQRCVSRSRCPALLVVISVWCVDYLGC